MKSGLYFVEHIPVKFIAGLIVVVFLLGMFVGVHSLNASSGSQETTQTADCTRRVYTYPPKPLECP